MEEKKPKTCPLKTDDYCQRNRCGWWNIDREQCAVISIPEIATRLKKINE